MKKFFASMVALMLSITMCFGFVGCTQRYTLGSILSNLGDNQGNCIVSGNADLIGLNTNSHNTITLKYEVNGQYSYSSYTTTNLSTQISWSEEYFYSISYAGYSCVVSYREKDSTSLWSITKKDTITGSENILNSLLTDANFKQFDESLFKEQNGVYILKNAITLSPKWNGFLSTLLYMSITPTREGADIAFTANSSSLIGSFNLNVTFGNSTLTTPYWV